MNYSEPSIRLNWEKKMSNLKVYCICCAAVMIVAIITGNMEIIKSVGYGIVVVTFWAFMVSGFD